MNDDLREWLSKKQEPRARHVVVIAIAVTLFALLWGMLTWVALLSLLGRLPARHSVEASPAPTLGDTVFFVLSLALFGFLSRVAFVLLFGVVTGRSSRFSLVPSWFIRPFLLSLAVSAVCLTVMAVVHRDWRHVIMLVSPVLMLIAHVQQSLLQSKSKPKGP